MKMAHDATGVEVFSREGCAACVALKRALARAGVAYVDRDVDCVANLSLLAWYDLPDTLPQVVIDGHPVEWAEGVIWDAEAMADAIWRRVNSTVNCRCKAVPVNEAEEE